jgi:ribosomal protein L7/L12
MLPSELSVEHRTVRANGLLHHYVEAGAGPLVLLLHGFPENWWAWRYQIRPLAEAGFRVVAPDLRGYNDTGKEGPYDLDTLGTDVCELIRALGAERAHLVGHDWGGAVAWHVASMRPMYADKIAVLNCPHPAVMTEALKTSWRQLRRSWYMFFFQLPLLPEYALLRSTASRFVHMYAKDGLMFSEEEVRPFVEGLRKPGAAKAMLGWYRAAFRGAVKRRGGPAYPRIDDYVLLLWGKKDLALFYDDVVPGTERYAPKLDIEVFESGGHFLNATQPERVNEALVEFFSVGRGEARPSAVAKRRAAAQGRSTFNVILANAGENKIGVIRELRSITGLELREARDLIESVPRTIKENASWHDAERIKSQLTAAGATVEIS